MRRVWRIRRSAQLPWSSRARRVRHNSPFAWRLLCRRLIAGALQHRKARILGKRRIGERTAALIEDAAVVRSDDARVAARRAQTRFYWRRHDFILAPAKTQPSASRKLAG